MARYDVKRLLPADLEREHQAMLRRKGPLPEQPQRDDGPSVRGYFSQGESTGDRYRHHPQLRRVILEDDMYAGKVDVRGLVESKTDPYDLGDALVRLYELAVQEANDTPNAQLQRVAYEGTNPTAVQNMAHRVIKGSKGEPEERVRKSLASLINDLTGIKPLHLSIFNSFFARCCLNF